MGLSMLDKIKELLRGGGKVLTAPSDAARGLSDLMTGDYSEPYDQYATPTEDAGPGPIPWSPEGAKADRERRAAEEERKIAEKQRRVDEAARAYGLGGNGYPAERKAKPGPTPVESAAEATQASAPPPVKAPLGGRFFPRRAAGSTDPAKPPAPAAQEPPPPPAVVAAASTALGAPGDRDGYFDWMKRRDKLNAERMANPSAARRIAGVALGADPLDDLEDRIRRQARADELEKNRASAAVESYMRAGSVGGMPGAGTLAAAGVTKEKLKAERDQLIAARKERTAEKVEARSMQRGLSPEEQAALKRRAGELKSRAAAIRAGAKAAMGDDDRDLA